MTLIQEGNRSGKIIICGESPRETKEKHGRPFSGGFGWMLDQMLERARIRRSDCFFTNVLHVPGELSKASKVDILHGLLQLKNDIETIKPNLVIALGSSALKVLTGKPSVDKWRGSILPCTLVSGRKVIPTLHPEQALRIYDYKAVIEFDLERCREQSAFPEIVYPHRTFYLHNVKEERLPDGSITRTELGAAERSTIVSEMLTASLLSIDIECWQRPDGSWELACVGFSDRPDRALVLATTGHGGFTERQLVRELCGCPAAKIFQNGTFDVTVLGREEIEVKNFHYDTMLGHHALYPECAGGEDEMAKLSGKKRSAAIQKGLAFQTSIYTLEPFYKDDGKTWKETNDLVKFWRYNALDAAVTREIYDEQQKLLDEEQVRCVADREMRLLHPVMAATNRGVRINMDVRQELHLKIQQEIDNLQSFLNEQAGETVNVKSTTQVKKLLYDKLKLPPKRNRKTKAISADKDAINELAGKYNHPVLGSIIAIRERRDLIERYLNARVDSDQRIRCNFDITGTRSGRLSSRASIFGSGTNLQNIPARKPIGEAIKRMFTADEGYCYVYRDFSQAEARVVAYLARCGGLIELFEDSKRDLHRENGSRIFGKPVGDVTDEERYLAKRVVHACNYGMGPDRLVQLVAEDAETTGIRIDRSTAQRLIDKYFLLYPEICENFWGEVKEQLRRTRVLNTPFGRKRTFYARMDEKLEREAYSYIPQSTVGDMGGMAFASCYWDIEMGKSFGAQLLLQVHDSILMQCPIESVEQTALAMADAMDIPVTIGESTFTIPTDCKVGLNWARRSNDNPNGLIDLNKGGREWLQELTSVSKTSLVA